MGTTTRAVKGTVSLQELLHTRRFKYRYQRQTYYVTLPRIKSPLELYVQKVIQQDIINGLHDNSLDRYKKLLVSDKHQQPNKGLNRLDPENLDWLIHRRSFWRIQAGAWIKTCTIILTGWF